MSKPAPEPYAFALDDMNPTIALFKSIVNAKRYQEARGGQIIPLYSEPPASAGDAEELRLLLAIRDSAESFTNVSSLEEKDVNLAFGELTQHLAALDTHRAAKGGK